MAHVILFVDDEPDVLELLRSTFPAADGYEALGASSGEEALKILAARGEVDLLVSDQRMPGMSGVELIERARRHQPDLCAILLTAYTNPKDIVEAINRGQVYRYLVKPWESADLRQTVVRALEQVYLKKERSKLLADAERRLVALEAASEIARDVGAADGPARLLERVVARLPRIVPCDVAAALLAPAGEAPTLIILPVAKLDERALLQVQEDALAAHRERAGGALDPGELRVRVLGRGEGPPSSPAPPPAWSSSRPRSPRPSARATRACSTSS
jgi:CheY-like chemotaxis protein